MLVELAKKKKKAATGHEAQGAGAAMPPAAQRSENNAPRKQAEPKATKHKQPMQNKTPSSKAAAKADGLEQHKVKFEQCYVLRHFGALLQEMLSSNGGQKY